MKTALIFTFLICVSFCMEQNLQNIVKYINSNKKNWTAIENFFTNMSKLDIQKTIGVHYKYVLTKPPLKTVSTVSAVTNIPSTFDARTKWPACSTIGRIRNQGACGSCWAFGAAESMSDRICIASGGKTNVNISVENLLACCSFCGDGCAGGDPSAAWQYWIQTGIVTGGDYNSNLGCQPYTAQPFINGITPVCMKQCRNGTNMNYTSNLRKGSSTYSVPANGIQTEVLNYGPVEAVLVVHEDFLVYRKGVYQYYNGTELGLHAVKILGWGTENKVKYWLVANSWGTSWGINGYCKIRRGVNETGIESWVVAGRV